jgi:hypothetical protein
METIKSGIHIDVRVKLSAKDRKISKAHIKSVALGDWSHIKSYTEFTQDVSQFLTE